MAKTRLLAATLAIIISTGAGVAVAQAAARDDRPTFGTMPDDAFVDGKFNREVVPDYISALGRDGEIVGWVKTDDVNPTSPEGDLLLPPDRVTVYADDGETPVGEMLPNVGFVPLGTDPAAIAFTPPTTVMGVDR